MRVVSGKYGSRPLKPVPGKNTRPTTDKIKESIFNLIHGVHGNGYMLDFYGGSGAIAIEAVSRGMAHAVITEKHPLALKTINENIKMTKEEDRFTVLSGDNQSSILSYQKNNPEIIFDLVMLDPPYKKEQIAQDIEFLTIHQLIDHASIIICETDNETFLPEQLDNWVKYRFKQYGLTSIHLYEWKES